MSLKQYISIERRFLRSTRIDTDLGDVEKLQGFICSESYEYVLNTMAQQIMGSGQSAFTWTGPYGGGKSSLVALLGAFLGENQKAHRLARQIIRKEIGDRIEKAMPRGSKGWKVIPVVGRPEDPIQVIGEAIANQGISSPPDRWSESALLKALVNEASSEPKKHGGLLLIIDEMGKFLEASIKNEGDIYVFQQLAEIASRSERLIVIGTLHQEFSDYARNLTWKVRDEWSKVQGRFIDIPVDTRGEEHIYLVSEAIRNKRRIEDVKGTREIAREIGKGRTASKKLTESLRDCWPLHPVATCLLGSFAKRRFGQNQRSVFGFLNSAETHGFQHFIDQAGEDDIYLPARLWDYLRINMEPAILASPDSLRWTLSVSAIERCEGLKSDERHLDILKTIAILDLFKERSRLAPKRSVLATCFPQLQNRELDKCLMFLQKNSLIIFRNFMDAYAIFAGSDFNLEDALRTEITDVHFEQVASISSLHPVLAKRHYQETGALRWFEMKLAPAHQIEGIASKYRTSNDAIGEFLLVIPTRGEKFSEIQKNCEKAVLSNQHAMIIAGTSENCSNISDSIRVLQALERISEYPELAGDAVARQEVSSRITLTHSNLGKEVEDALKNVTWAFRGNTGAVERSRHSSMANLASQIADIVYPMSPRIHSELINRQRPSGSANGAIRNLLHRMVLSRGELRLGIEGWPAEGGLFASMLEWTRLYREKDGEWRFTSPDAKNDPAGIAPMWKAAIKHLENEAGAVPLSSIYSIWSAPPFGLKYGPAPVLATALILAEQRINLYRQGVFRTQFDDVDADYLMRDPDSIQLRWLDLDDDAKGRLDDFVSIAQDFGVPAQSSAPVDVGRALVSIYDKLPQWTQRTSKVSSETIKIREIFKRAYDPNRFIFDDLSDPAETRQALSELQEAYSAMLQEMKALMLMELDAESAPMKNLNIRAQQVIRKSGDWRLDAFATRLVDFDGSYQHVETILSLAANQPLVRWSDADESRARIDLVELCQKFVRAEMLIKVEGRKGQHMAVALAGVNGHPGPKVQEFMITEKDEKNIANATKKVERALGKELSKSQALAVLARIADNYLEGEDS